MEREIHEQQTCKVCMVGRRDTVFVPCGHMVCCVRCAQRVHECPVCRIAIDDVAELVVVNHVHLVLRNEYQEF